ncbi:MAG: hypothetical protein R2699_02645 [Acidimicrobiales bacterium]
MRSAQAHGARALQALRHEELVDAELAQNIKSAKRMVERRRPQVWTVLEEVIKEHPVLLNRAPTLHRLGIQAFEPVLVEGKAIQIHPLVCTAFNADFDGDQMAVHLPLSAEAQAESRVLMLSANNMLSPADGRPLVTPTQDMIIGAYYLTEDIDGGLGEGQVFRHLHQVERAYESGAIDLHALIEYRVPELAATADDGTVTYTRTTAGRILFNRALPVDFRFVNARVDKRAMGQIVDELAADFPKADAAVALDAIKDLCFRFAARSGLTISVDDVKTPVEKREILDGHEREAEKVETQFRRGIITDGERRQKEVEIWTTATEEVRAAMERALKADKFNPIDMMVGSGARGNMMQVRQIAGMRGLVANPRGDMIPRPIKSNFREGLAMLEYFIATPGARKGLVDTALRTADSGYLTRRLVDVAQEVIINDHDPFAPDEDGTVRPVRGMWIENVQPDRAGHRSHLETRLFSRTLADDMTVTGALAAFELDDAGKPGLTVLGWTDSTETESGKDWLEYRIEAKASGDTATMTLPKGTVVREAELALLRDDASIDRVRVLSPLTDDSPIGISAAAYGLSLATGRMIEPAEAVGVIAAQSIGEPGTQLTMRTFHTGGIAGRDIAGGLPRVVELFEARSPKGKAVLASTSGVVRISEDEGRGKIVTVVDDEGNEDAYTLPAQARLEVVDGQEVIAGDPIIDGPRDPKELLEIKGIRETQQYIVDEVQAVYRDQGVPIHDKHIELIVRQMTKKVAVQEPGESEFLPGERVDSRIYTEANRALVSESKRPAEARPEIMGITKASLATDSWLSAASFQETTRVLTEAAIGSRSDNLLGLKENIIIGKLIPAGTGQAIYRDIAVEAPDYQPMEFYSSFDEEQDLAEWLAGRSEATPAGEVVGESSTSPRERQASAGAGRSPASNPGLPSPTRRR